MSRSILAALATLAFSTFAAMGAETAPAEADGAPGMFGRFPASCPVQLGEGADLGGMRPFPDDNPWNQDVSSAPVDPNSDAIIARLGPEAGLHPDFGSGLWDGARIGVPYVVVPEDQPLVPVRLTAYWRESDRGRFPVPPNAPIQNWGTTLDYSDDHVVVLQRDPTKPNCLGKLYEMFLAEPVGDYPRSVEYWRAASGALFDLNSNALRPHGWTSADAAGMPIFPGLVRYDEVARAVQDHANGGEGVVPHAFRFSLAPGYTRRAYVEPARHWASWSDDPHLAPFGMRVRLKADFVIEPDWPAEVQAILRTLKKYGMFMADNGGNWFVSGAPDERWDNSRLAYLHAAHGAHFEVVQMGKIVTP